MYVYVYVVMLFREDVIALKMMGTVKGGILITPLFAWLIWNN
jgi:hypothetical protein